MRPLLVRVYWQAAGIILMNAVSTGSIQMRVADKANDVPAMLISRAISLLRSQLFQPRSVLRPGDFETY